MCGENVSTEAHVESHSAGGFASLVAFYEPDDERLAVTRHTDGHVTIRIGRDGHGPRKELSPDVVPALAAMLAAPSAQTPAKGVA
ncbi:hypothetical protein [Bifidobacterium parmae]|uniref:Uncharacterized protein n=1 Tax=Bifidobacterium parmae TaxID=361854 RepID=A0A2N5IVL3_9BIFI|nr:hypothetical protein [Bifidobacterium parmae]PLS26002.1 hypothetical protein Uis4E_2177 [Bifidobacterium parmae]